MWLRTAGGALLVPGTAIGGGMISLPTVTAAAGFQYTFVCFTLCWMVMTLTALWMLELVLRYPTETNLISIAKRTLGPWAAYMAWGVYLLFMYAVMTAYTTGGAAITHGLLGHGWTYTTAILLFVAVFGGVVTLGAHWVDRLNRVFMLFLVLAYIGLVGAIGPHIEVPQLMAAGEPSALLTALPLIVTAFGFQLLIPSLATHLNYQPQMLRRAIFWGSLCAFGIYILWVAVILGTIPLADLQAIAETGDPVMGTIIALKEAFGLTYIPRLARVFTFCALLTSFIGVGLGIFDFLADGLQIKKTPRGRLLLALLTFGPPLYISMGDPSGFIAALRYAGIFGSILLILYPALMAWKERQLHPVATTYRVPIGNLGFLFAVLCAGLVIMVQVVAYWPA